MRINSTLIRYAALWLVAASGLAACSTAKSNSAPEQLDIEVKNSAKVYIDPALQKSSKAMHYYLMGQLLYNQEDFGKALENFERASKLSDDPAPVLHTKLAELLVRSGELEKALEECRQALEQTPEDPSTMLLYAGILEALKRSDEAEPIYKKLIDSKREGIDAYVLLASLYIKRQEVDKGIQILQRMVSENPKEPIGYAYLGRALEIKGNLPEAENRLKRSIELDPDNVGFMIDLMRVYLKQKKIETAKTVCNQVIEKDPTNVQARKVLGQLLIGESRFDEALDQLQVLETMEPDATETRFKIALIQIGKQQFKEAATELNLVLAGNPKYPDARYYLASAYAALGRKNEAIEELLKVENDESMFVQSRTFAAFLLKQEKRTGEAEKTLMEAFKEKPDDPALLAYLVVLMRENNHLKEAQEILEEALSDNPADEKLLFSYSTVLYDSGRKAESLETMERLIVVNPKHSDALNFVAYDLAETKKDLKRAEELVNRALVVRPNDGYYLDTLGWVYYHKGLYKQAVETLAKAVSLVPGDAVILEHYGDALSLLSEKPRALEIYREALKKLEEDGSSDAEVARPRLQDKVSELISELGGT